MPSDRSPSNDSFGPVDDTMRAELVKRLCEEAHQLRVAAKLTRHRTHQLRARAADLAERAGAAVATARRHRETGRDDR